MSQDLFAVDGTFYNVKIPSGGIKRNFQVLDDDTAGRVMSGEMHRSIIGTYYNYTIDLDTSHMSRSEYDSMYEVLSAPQAYHTLQVPYGQNNFIFQAYITAGEDVLDTEVAGVRTWKGLSVNFIAVAPQRR